MDISIRRAVKEDCIRLLELVQELATYEKAPNEVTVTLFGRYYCYHRNERKRNWQVII